MNYEWTRAVGFWLVALACQSFSYATESENTQDRANARCAVIDMIYVLKHFPSFAESCDQLGEELASARTAHQEGQSVLAKMKRSLDDYNAQSVEFKGLTLDIARMEGEIDANWELARERFLTNRSWLYENAYGRIQSEILKFMEENDCEIVMNSRSRSARGAFSTGPFLLELPDRTDNMGFVATPLCRSPDKYVPSREEVIGSVRQLIDEPVVAHKRLDISQLILKRLREQKQRQDRLGRKLRN